jgi:uncharacterized glyoxalase superfamily protein PhnB
MKYPNPPEGWPQISASLSYADPSVALEFLAKAFGFEIRVRYADPDGSVAHAELELGEGLVMLGPSSAAERRLSPRDLDGANTQTLYVFVDDVEAHCERARRAGAVIFREPEDSYYGHRVYGAEDLEGHRWFFGQKTRESGPEAEAGG